MKWLIRAFFKTLRAIIGPLMLLGDWLTTGEHQIWVVPPVGTPSGQVFALPLQQKNDYKPNLDTIPDDIRQRAKLMVLNYPNSPTGSLADEKFYKQVIEFAKANNIVVVQDAAHIMLTYGRKPLSFLQVDGARDVGVEVHSMSKGFNMIGWRLGFLAGHERLVAAFADVKDNTDSGQFKAIQLAACAGIADRKLADSIKDHYEARLSKLVATLRQAGFAASMPGGTFYLYVSAPSGAGSTSFANAEDASQFLIKEHSISTVPWDDAGAFLRFSATFESAVDDDDDRVMAELAQRLESADVRWD